MRRLLTWPRPSWQTSSGETADDKAAMAGSTFGTIFRVTTFGESHCKGVGAIIDGVPHGIWPPLRRVHLRSPAPPQALARTHAQTVLAAARSRKI